MRTPAAIAAFLLLCAAAQPGLARGARTPSADGQAAARHAMAAPPAGCIDGRHLLSHAAYIPTNAAAMHSCGHLLSTDTLLSVHHWDQT